MAIGIEERRTRNAAAERRKREQRAASGACRDCGAPLAVLDPVSGKETCSAMCRNPSVAIVHASCVFCRQPFIARAGGAGVPCRNRECRTRAARLKGYSARSAAKTRAQRQAADDGIVTGLTLPVDAAELGAWMAERDVALLVLDPLTSVMDGRIDAHRDREVRTALEPLGRLAEQTGAAVLGLVHLGKGMGTDPVNLILGSRAFSAVARVALVAARDPEDEATCVLSVEKSNLGRLDVPALTYRVDGMEVATDEGPAATGLLTWTGETDRRVRDILADHGEDHTDRDQAADWLTGYLMDSGGEAPANDVKAAARKAGFSERTLDRARKPAKVTTGRAGFGKGAVYYWRLEIACSPHARHARQDSDPGEHGGHGGGHEAGETSA